MPYSSVGDLPDGVREALPLDAQRIYKNAYNAVYEKYDDESVRSQIAWTAVKQKYKRDEDGDWVKKRADNIVKTDKMLNYTLGIVYEPNELDTQDEFTDEDELRKAAWDYVKSLQKQDNKVTKVALEVLEGIVKSYEEDVEYQVDLTDFIDDKEAFEKQVGLMHDTFDDDLGILVDTMILPVDTVMNGQKLKKGTWLVGIEWSDDAFVKVLKGEITGYSMGGKGYKLEVSEVAEETG